MNMYLHELKSLRKSTLIWAGSMIALALLYLSVYTGIASDAEGFKQLLGAYPPAVRSMLGISLDNIASLLGYYSMVFWFIQICGAIQSMNYGLSVLSKEVRERTSDFLLVKPVSRVSIVTAKLLAALTMLVVTNVIYYAGAFVIANVVKTAAFNDKLFFMLNATMLFVQLIFFSTGVVISVFIPKLKSVIPVSLGIVFGFYILGAVISLGKDDWTRFLSPFKYFDNSYILSHSGYETPYLIAGAVIVFFAVTASYIIYIKKDIHAV